MDEECGLFLCRNKTWPRTFLMTTQVTATELTLITSTDCQWKLTSFEGLDQLSV